MKKHYENKLVFLLGASEGIGLSIAKLFVSYGAQVLIASRSEKKLEKAIQELEPLRQSPDQIIEAQSIDLTNTENTSQALTDWLKKYGTPDYLIINAGFGKPGFMTDLEVKDYEDMVNLNYLGAVRAIKPLLPAMIKAQKGHIVLTSSIAGFVGLFGYTGYCPTKYAQIGFAEALKAEIKQDNIKVSVLCPPNTDTPGFAIENQFKPDEVLKTEEKIKSLTPDEVAISFMKQLHKGKFFIIPTFDGKLALYLKRFFPSILNLAVKRPEKSK